MATRKLPAARPQPGQHGGKRPGAGAPKGNFNAVKLGRHSLRLRALIRVLASTPEVRDFLIEVRRRQMREERKAARIARNAILDLVISHPDKNNPIIAYLLATIVNEGKTQKSAKLSSPELNNQDGPTPVSAPRP